MNPFFLVLSLHLDQISQEPKPKRQYPKTNFENGALKSEGGLLDGQKTRYWKFYNAQATLIAEGHYQKGRQTKYWYYYHFSAQLKTEALYKNSLKTKGWNSYTTNGELVEKCQYKNNKHHGYRVLSNAAKPNKVELYAPGIKQKVRYNYKQFILNHPQFLGA